MFSHYLSLLDRHLRFPYALVDVHLALGVGVFALIRVGAVIAYSAFRMPSAPATEQESGAQAPTAPQQAPKSGGFMDRLEDRWRKRNEEGGL